MYHFGCILKNQMQLSEQHYAEITPSSLKKSHIPTLQKLPYQNLSFKETESLFWKQTGIFLYMKLQQELSQYKNLYYQTLQQNNPQILNDYQNKAVHQTTLHRNKGLLSETEYQKQLSLIRNADIRTALADTAHPVLQYILRHLNDPFFPENEWTINDFLKDYIEETTDYPYHGKITAAWYQNRAKLNFYYNMNYFDTLSVCDYQNELSAFLSKNPAFHELTNLSYYETIPGIYIMCLTHYKQIYIGYTSSKHGIKGRIQQHWSKQIPLDSLVFQNPCTSPLSIDAFFGRDTTRIFAASYDKLTPHQKQLRTKQDVTEQNQFLKSEEQYLIQNAFSQKYLCNRGRGGENSANDALSSNLTRPMATPPIKKQITMHDLICAFLPET